jgi:hypothetical protein
MKELMGNASNMILIPSLDDGKVEACVELALICSEQVFEFDAGGIKKTHEVSTVKLVASGRQLRELASLIIKLADQAKKMEEAINSKSDALG